MGVGASEIAMSDQIRVLYIANSHTWGGGEQVVFMTARLMAARGHHVAVAAAASTPLATACIESGVSEFLPIDIGPKLGRGSIGAFLWRARSHRRRLLRLVMRQELPWDVVHLQYKKEQLLVSRALAALGVRVIWTEHGGLPRGIRRNPFARRWYLASARRTAGIAAVSQYVREDLVQAGVPPSKVKVIYTGVNRDRFGLSPAARHRYRQAVHSALGWDPAATVVGTASRIAPGKGISQLVDAFAAVSASRPALHLLVVGTGSELALAERAAPEALRRRIAFVGFQPDVPRYLAAMDLFVSPTQDPTEGFPLRVVEAMAAGLPVIATRVAGQPEIVEDGRNGLLVPGTHGPALAAAMAALSDDTERRAEMARRALATADAFSEQRYAEAHEQFLMRRPGDPM